MVEKGFLLRFLRINNLSEEDPDEKIEAMLREAQWSDREINYAFVMLGRRKMNEADLQKDMIALNPELMATSDKISGLLGVDVIIDPHSESISSMRHKKSFNLGVNILIITSAVVLALGLAVGVMYFLVNS